MPAITATIITRDEAASIARAIQSVSFADEIIVVDSGSTDSTVEVARRAGARVEIHAWEGFAAQKNVAASLATYDWIVSLDADEEFTPEAQESMKRWKALEPAAAGYRFARRAQYLGRWILHSGWYPDYKLRLYDRRAGEWQGAYVHESVAVRGKVETLAGEILHYTCDSLADHKKRIEFYTELAAKEMAERKQRGGLAGRFLAPVWIFFNTFFLRLGILDGVPGFWIAWMAARYVNRKYAKLSRILSEAGVR